MSLSYSILSKVATYQLLGAEPYRKLILNQILTLESELIQSVQGKVVDTKPALSAAKTSKRQRRRGKAIHKNLGHISLESVEKIVTLKKRLALLQADIDIKEAFGLDSNTSEFNANDLHLLQRLANNGNAKDRIKKEVIDFAVSMVKSSSQFLRSKHTLKAQEMIVSENHHIQETNEFRFLELQRAALAKACEAEADHVFEKLQHINVELNSTLVKLARFSTQCRSKPSHVLSMYQVLTKNGHKPRK
jgi:hypothetical protein